MNLELPNQMRLFRERVDRESRSLKDPYHALECLQEFYSGLDADDRLRADAVLMDWTRSDDEGLRFDALVLIDGFKIVAAIGALESLAARLESASTPGAPYELLKVQRILQGLRGC